MGESPYRVLDFGQLQVQLQIAPVTEESLRAHLEEESARIRRLLAEEKQLAKPKAVVIHDASVNIFPAPTVRRIQAEWMKHNQDLLKLVCQAVSFVVPNGAVRNALTAMFWFAPLPMPIVLHETMDLAIDWAITEVDRMGGSVSAEILLEGAMAIEKARIALEKSGEFRSLWSVAAGSKRAI